MLKHAGAGLIAWVGLAIAAGPAAAQLSSCQVGQAVAAKNFRDRWAPAVVIAVEPGKPYPCRVHMLGYNDLEQQSWAPSMLRPASAATEPPGALTSDPWLQKVQGKAAPAKPGAIIPGAYECYALTGGRLSPRLTLNFTIVDGRNYRDASGASGTYSFDAGSGGIVFTGAGLNGQRATYSQPATPPTRNNPPNVTYVVSGDSCDLKM
ncbi:MAG TPA: hypothetical protein VMI56_04745 [Reyranella sp.]|nr:hypothetical protein [Reyranella sp.]